MSNPIYSRNDERETPERRSFDFLFDGSGNGLPCATAPTSASEIKLKTSYGVSVFTPMDYLCTYAYPLLVWLHSQEGSEDDLLKKMPKISLKNYIGVAPQGFAKKNGASAWPLLCLSDIESRVLESVERVKKQFNVNSRRIFLAGMDAGGTAAMALALARPDVFAGAAAFNAPAPRSPMMFRQFKLQKKQSYFVGFPEDSQLYSPVALKEDIDAFTNAGLNIQFKEYKGQTFEEQIYPDINRWIMRSINTAVF